MESKNAAREIARPKRTAPQCYIFGSLNQVRFSEAHDHYLRFNFKSKDITTRAPRGYPDFCELLRIHRRTIDEILVGEGKRELRHRFAHIWQGDPNPRLQPTPQPTLEHRWPRVRCCGAPTPLPAGAHRGGSVDAPLSSDSGRDEFRAPRSRQKSNYCACRHKIP